MIRFSNSHIIIIVSCNLVIKLDYPHLYLITFFQLLEMYNYIVLQNNVCTNLLWKNNLIFKYILSTFMFLWIVCFYLSKKYKSLIINND